MAISRSASSASFSLRAMSALTLVTSMGLEVVNFNIQNFKDAAGTIENMGIDNVEQIRKNAQIAKANSRACCPPAPG